MVDKVTKSDDEWQAALKPEEYYICRGKGTEPAFTGRYWKTTTPGTYVCVCCGQDLFASDAKFHSSSGWPSFYQAVDGDRVITETDSSHGMIPSRSCIRRWAGADGAAVLHQLDLVAAEIRRLNDRPTGETVHGDQEIERHPRGRPCPQART